MKASWSFLLLWVLLVLGICVGMTEDRLAATTGERPAATSSYPQQNAALGANR
jgi:hypothetical protein